MRKLLSLFASFLMLTSFTSSIVACNNTDFDKYNFSSWTQTEKDLFVKGYVNEAEKLTKSKNILWKDWIDPNYKQSITAASLDYKAIYEGLHDTWGIVINDLNKIDGINKIRNYITWHYQNTIIKDNSVLNVLSKGVNMDVLGKPPVTSGSALFILKI